MYTVWLSVGPSVVVRLHDQVPPPVSVTEPIEALNVTGSPSGSLKVPVADASCPSLTVTAAVFVLTYGRSLPLGSTTSNSEIMPKLAWKKMWQWNTHRPSPPPAVTPSIFGRSSSRTRYLSVNPGSTLSLCG